MSTDTKAPRRPHATVTKGRSLTAAAQILQGRRIDRAVKPKGNQSLGWQTEGWDYYDKVGEFSIGIDMQAWAVSQVRIVSAKDVTSQDEPEVITADVDPEAPAEEQPSEADIIAAELAAEFAGGSIGQQQLMRRVATQLGVVAESFIVGRDMGPDQPEVWEAYSRDDVKWSTSGWKVDDGIDKFPIGDDDVLIRVWIPHPRRRQEPRSSTKALLPTLCEIWTLTQSLHARSESRLAGAGLLILPNSVELVGSQKAGDDAEDDEDPFLNEVMDMMITPIKDRDSAAAVVPIIIKVADEVVGNIKYIRFESTVDMREAEDREKAVVRLARGMDLPPEEILGMGDSNHWTGWLVSENTIKGPVTSLAAIIVHALTVHWYQPALEAAYEANGIDRAEADGRMLWFDTSPLDQRPDLSENAVLAFDRGGLKLSALVRELGFADTDMPEPEELLRILLFMLVKADPALAVPLIDRTGLLEQILAGASTARDPVTDPPVETPAPADRVLPDQGVPTGVPEAAA